MTLLREINIDDAQILFDWANDPEVRKMSINTEPILWNNHLNWFQRKLSDKTGTKMFILEANKEVVGQIRFEFHTNLFLGPHD